MMVLLPLPGMTVKSPVSSSMLLPGGPGMTRRTAERWTYERTRETKELRDRLRAERLMAEERTVPRWLPASWMSLLPVVSLLASLLAAGARWRGTWKVCPVEL